MDNNNEIEDQLGLCLAVPTAWCMSLGFGGWIQASNNSARFVRQLRRFQKLEAVHQPSELRWFSRIVFAVFLWKDNTFLLMLTRMYNRPYSLYNILITLEHVRYN